jgi:CheY-like chemotaxis protein
VAAVNAGEYIRRNEPSVPSSFGSHRFRLGNSISGRPRRELRILVAEDSPDNQLIVSRLLSRRGHQVVVVSDGRAAVRLVQTAHFDVVLMDIHMPEMDGMEATRAIRARLGADLPIVAFSAYTSPIDRNDCIAAGMNAFLAKPADFGLLTQTIEELCHD